jgi:cysteinyl-tRNA synthetase
MGAAKGALKRMDNVMKQLDDALDGYDLHGDIVSDGDMVAVVQKELHNFETAVADDLSMPRAAASLFGVVKAAETEFKRYKKAQKDDASGDDVTSLDLDGLGSVKNAIVQMDRVFGVFYDVPKEKNDDGSEKEEEVVDDSISEEVMELVRSRTEAKEAKDWGVADLLRGQITDLGFAVKDVKGGDPIVTRI